MVKKVLLTLTSFLFIILLCDVSIDFLLKPKNNINNSVDWHSLNYTAVGDSITYGYTPKTDNVQMEKPYCSAVADILGLSFFTNLGISGSTLTNKWHGMARRLDTIPENSSIISVFGGTNDWGRSRNLGIISDSDDSSIYGSLNIICSYLTLNFKDSFIFLITPYPRHKAGVNSAGYTLYDVRDAVINVGQKFNIPVLNFTDFGLFEIEMDNKNISDGIHPTQEFILNYTAPQIAQFIRENYKK